MAVREGLLALLDGRKSHGYQLKTSFEAAVGGAWPLNVGQVYQTLERLERDGLVRSDKGGDLRSYVLTAEGAAELGAWWDADPADEPPPRDELMLKVLLAVPRGREHALEVITAQRDVVMARMQQRRRSSRAGGRGLAAAMVADAIAVRAEADLRWLDLCEERLTSEPDAPVGEARRTSARKTTRGART